MHLSPADILKYLGFDIPEEGIDINPADAYLYTTALRLTGETMNVSHISDEKLTELRGGMEGVVAMWAKQWGAQPPSLSKTAPTQDDLQRLRGVITAFLQRKCKRQSA
jgi:hypothetical protein